MKQLTNLLTHRYTLIALSVLAILTIGFVYVSLWIHQTILMIALHISIVALAYLFNGTLSQIDKYEEEIYESN